MKKGVIMLILLIIPINILAYSTMVIPGGENIGIMVKEKGISIIGFYNNDNSDLKIGDQIIKVGNDEVNTIDELITSIKANVKNNQVNITYLRGDKQINTTLKLKYIDGLYKTGLYVKDNVTGIGTLTYIDPNTKVYGSLGHEIINSNTKKRIEVDDGYIFNSKVTSIRKSGNGNPGGKNATFNQSLKYGSVSKNTIVGIYGTYDNIPDKELIEVANPNEIKLGEASILTTLNDNQVKSYQINIKKININNTNKNIYFEITDNILLKQTGGIVQGMSGSPIIQNDKLIGAVTHVIINDVSTGYGVFITTMLKEGDK